MVAVAAPAALDFERVYAEHYDQVFHHVRRLVTHPEVAEDLTGQTFLKAYEAWGRYEERGLPIAAWLIRIARNQVTSYMRSKRSHTALDDSYEDDDETPEDQVLRKLDAAAVTSFIQRLGSPLQRQVLTLHYCDGLTPNQVAEATGKSVSHIRVTEHRALAHLRRMVLKGA